MSRNYKKEYEQKIKNYDEIRANINKELGSKLRKKLKEENKTIAGWVTDNAKNYLKEGYKNGRI